MFFFEVKHFSPYKYDNVVAEKLLQIPAFVINLVSIIT